MAIRRGDTAKETVKNKIIQAFDQDFVTIQDKKIIVQASDGGEIVQIAISLTMPKVQVTAGAWSEDPDTSVAAVPTQLSSEDEAKIKQLRSLLNL